ncbi:hypothetical protein L6164_026559 [Bauhinia variegata]|uniref:Uncharacterized protein n=1 Tax=Bauhinia variegata TaxID=167791 RepID=A0ACB9LS06_BAUVA|nr:hypothetical protein L6164_026559 [Bauhinia variegata]
MTEMNVQWKVELRFGWLRIFSDTFSALCRMILIFHAQQESAAFSYTPLEEIGREGRVVSEENMGSVEDDVSVVEEGLLQDERSKEYTGDGSVDFKGMPARKNNTGNWRACPFILGNECCERLAYYGIATNLVTYLTNKLHEGNVSAARNVTTWQGTCYLTPLIGAVLADAYWGRYWTIAGFSTIYFIGMCTLSLSATIPAFKPSECVGSICPSATPVQYAVFFFGLYLIALGTGGIKPCVSSFGADQFDDTDPKERVKKGSFFNWFYFSINIGALVSSSLIVWIQDNAGWGLGFGIPALFMGLAIGSFFLGTPLYRFQKPGGSPVTRMCQVVVASFRKRNLHVPEDSSLLYETPDKSSAIEGSRKLEHSNELTCLDKAAVVSDKENKTGNYLSSLILTVVTYFTTRGGHAGWITDNLNAGHLDYFFWLLAGLSFLNLLVYIVCAKRYKQKKAS